jgi:glycosyltransferase involved in cell wall biosynthesis
LSRFPDTWMPAFAAMHEIWAPSRFIQTALAGRLDRPVVYIPIAIELNPIEALPRARLGLPGDRFLFFYAFDFLSFMERKNPRAAVAAFRRAFATRGQAGLVLKCMNGALVPDQFDAFKQVIDNDPDIILIDQTLSRAETLGLIAAIDSVISLHRSEGLGLLIAEAMLLGKPVIATDYSGSREFVTNNTGYPVEFKLVPVRNGDYPFAEGQVWAEPDVAHAAWHMRRLVNEPDRAVAKLDQARAFLRQNYSRASVALLQTRRLQSLLAP